MSASPTRQDVIDHLRPWSRPIGFVESWERCFICCKAATHIAWRISPDTVGGLPGEVLICDDAGCLEDLAWSNEQRLAAVWRLRDAELAKASAERAQRLRILVRGPATLQMDGVR